MGEFKNTPSFCLEMMKHAIGQLALFLEQALRTQLEPIRIARSAYALLGSGCSAKGTFPGSKIAAYLVDTQHDEGGWADTEETLWCLGYLTAFSHRYKLELAKGENWLASVQLPCGAWGKSERDQPRIPTTALATVLVPDIVLSTSLTWLTNQWEADLDNSTQLTYKGAFFLLAHAHSQASQDNSLVNRTLAYLNSEQEEDGGFGPWKGHPVASDPWSTGVALWGFSRVGELAPRQTIERALSWLKSKQLSNGLWPYHYLDDGTAMALIGISSALPFLTER